MLFPSSASVYLLIHVYSYRRVRQAARCTTTIITSLVPHSLQSLARPEAKRTASQHHTVHTTIRRRAGISTGFTLPLCALRIGLTIELDYVQA